MSSTAIVPQQSAVMFDRDFSVESLKNRRETVKRILTEVMVMGLQNDYAAIPGTGDKKTLLKPGAEKICAVFGIAVEPIVEQIKENEDGDVTYRVTCRVTSIASGVYLGSGIGEASTLETKFAWRGIVCDQEWQEAEAWERRSFWRRGFNGKPAEEVRQVRENPRDKSNTVLKMAKKRALIDAVLTVTGASDIFTQDLEEKTERNEGKSTAPVSGARAQQAQSSNVEVITSEQGRAFWNAWKKAGRTKEEVVEYMKLHCGGITSDKYMPVQYYAEALRWAGSKEPVPAVKTQPAETPATPGDQTREKINQAFQLLDIDLAEQADLLGEYHGRMPELLAELNSRLDED